MTVEKFNETQVVAATKKSFHISSGEAFSDNFDRMVSSKRMHSGTPARACMHTCISYDDNQRVLFFLRGLAEKQLH